MSHSILLGEREETKGESHRTQEREREKKEEKVRHSKRDARLSVFNVARGHIESVERRCFICSRADGHENVMASEAST